LHDGYPDEGEGICATDLEVVPAANSPCALGPPPLRGSGSPAPRRLFLLARRRGIIDGLLARVPHMGFVEQNAFGVGTFPVDIEAASIVS
jgi:hypothetical protein